MLSKIILTLGLTLTLATPAMAQVSNLLAPRRQNEFQGPAAETTSPVMNMMEFINQASFMANTRSPSEFIEDSQGGISRAAEAFRAQQRQMLNAPTTSVEVKPVP